MTRLCKWHACQKPIEAVPKRKLKVFCTRNCANKYHVTFYRRRAKRRLVELAGGRCVSCGYNRCMAALQFHHRDPSMKEIEVGKGGNVVAWSKLVEEIKKCDLLCANCHAERHDAEQFQNPS